MNELKGDHIARDIEANPKENCEAALRKAITYGARWDQVDALFFKRHRYRRAL